MCIVRLRSATTNCAREAVNLFGEVMASTLSHIDDDNELLPLGEVERITGHARHTIVRRILEGALPAIVVQERSRRRWLVRRADVRAFVGGRSCAGVA
jgi:hypothetical protein